MRVCCAMQGRHTKFRLHPAASGVLPMHQLAHALHVRIAPIPAAPLTTRVGAAVEAIAARFQCQLQLSMGGGEGGLQRQQARQLVGRAGPPGGPRLKGQDGREGWLAGVGMRAAELSDSRDERHK